MTGLVVAVVAVVLIGLFVYLSRFVQHPEQAASHGDPDATTRSERLYGSADRPAGPDVDDFVTPDQQAEADGAIRSAGSSDEEPRGGPS